MRTIRTPMQICRRLLAVSAALAALIWASTPAFADEAKPDELRAQAERLMRKAADLKAQGSTEESAKVAREAEELQRAAKKFESEKAQHRERAEAQPPEKREQIQRLRARLEELSAAGKMEPAAKVKQEIAELEKARNQTPRPAQLAEAKEHLLQLRQHIQELHEKGRHEEAERTEEQARRVKEKIVATEQGLGPGKESPKFAGPEHARMQEQRPGLPSGPLVPRQTGPPQEETGRRLQHLRAAIENLHAAGMHEPAQRLAEEAERMQRQVRDPRSTGPRGPSPARREEMVQGLQGEIQELRHAVQELRRQVEELRQAKAR